MTKKNKKILVPKCLSALVPSKSAFTLAEIVVAIVVMAIVASIVVPITRDKFEKVDYASYYLGYKVAQTIVGIDIPPTEEEEDELCKISEDVCFTMGFIPEPASLAECINMKSTHGIHDCCYDKDYWAGTVKMCGGVENLPTATHLARLSDYIFGTTDTDPYGETSYVSIDKGTLTKRWASVGIKYDMYSFINIWSKEEEGRTSASVRRFHSGSSVWLANNPAWGSRDYAIMGICVKYKNAENGEGSSSGTSGSASAEMYTFDDFCKSITNTLSGSQKDCTISVNEVQTVAKTKDFSSLTPHFTLNNGLKVYMASEYDTIEQLDDSVDESDSVGWVIYIDVDGNRSKSRLYDDVFPFYLTKSGKVIPGYDADIVAGANCEKNLAFDVLYDEFDTLGSRKLKRLDGSSITTENVNSFQNAACLSGYVKSTKYCGMDYSTVTVNGINCRTNTNTDCRMQVRKPLKIFR